MGFFGWFCVVFEGASPLKECLNLDGLTGHEKTRQHFLYGLFQDRSLIWSIYIPLLLKYLHSSSLSKQKFCCWSFESQANYGCQYCAWPILLSAAFIGDNFYFTTTIFVQVVIFLSDKEIYRHISMLYSFYCLFISLCYFSEMKISTDCMVWMVWSCVVYCLEKTTHDNIPHYPPWNY